jgi:hypothetical protein
MRNFEGLSVEEDAEAFCLSPGTVNRDWAEAKGGGYMRAFVEEDWSDC